MMRAGDVVIIAIVVVFGTDAVAGNAIGEVLTQFNYMPIFGVATATVMLVGHAVGEGDMQEVGLIRQRTFWLSFSCIAGRFLKRKGYSAFSTTTAALISLIWKLCLTKAGKSF